MLKTDLEIARENKMENIVEIAKKLNISSDYIEQYGKFKAKISLDILKNCNKEGNLILVTSINPTPAGEGKTTTTIGIGDAINRLGKKSVIVLREPSLGPVFGVKGGATGGGYSQVVPMEDINLHFTGDFNAIEKANNLLSSIIDNHIFQGNELNIDSRKIVWKRCIDINDRQLRKVIIGLGDTKNGIVREEEYIITVASEIMAILCLINSIEDLKEKLSRIIVAYDYNDNPITVKDLNAQGAMTILLKDAIKPNLVQTLEKTPALVHGGPFANIAHGCNSIIATKMALNLGEYVITEAGFGADLGAQKFLDIKCRLANIKPSVVVIVATIRALKMHGNLEKDKLDNLNLECLKKGINNLYKHINNIKNCYNLPVIVALNRFYKDYEEEIDFVKKSCEKIGTKVLLSNVWAEGSNGAIDIAKEIISLSNNESNIKFTYELQDTIEQKITSIVTKIYGGKGVVFEKKAKENLEKIKKLGFEDFHICMAKTQYSFSDNAELVGEAKDFDITIKEIKIFAGAGFLVVLTGDIMTMPSLPKLPAANNMDIDNDGIIKGLF